MMTVEPIEIVIVRQHEPASQIRCLAKPIPLSVVPIGPEPAPQPGAPGVWEWLWNGFYWAWVWVINPPGPILP